MLQTCEKRYIDILAEVPEQSGKHIENLIITAKVKNNWKLARKDFSSPEENKTIKKFSGFESTYRVG